MDGAILDGRYAQLRKIRVVYHTIFVDQTHRLGLKRVIKAAPKL
jgi:hypothetical protein